MLRKAFFYSNSGEFKKANFLFNYVSKNFKNLHYNYGKYKYLDFLSIQNANIGQLNIAMQNCKEAFKIASKLNATIEKEDLQRRIGYLLMANGKLDEAKKYVEIIKKYIEKDQSNYSNYLNYLFISEVYFASED